MSHVLDPMIEAYIVPEGRKILWRDNLWIIFMELNHMVSDEMLLSYKYWKITFIVHTYDFEKKLVSVIS